MRRRARVRDGALRSLVDFLDAFMWQADPASLRITFVSESVAEVLGHPGSRWVGPAEHWTENIHAEDRERVLECLRATADDGRDREVEFRAQTADGRHVVLRHSVRLLTDANGAPELWGLTTDRTEDRRTKERYRALSRQAAEFRRRALEDPLTRLPNRILLDDRLGTALRAGRRSGERCAVLLMDLDGFKEINDTRGHQAGDEVLKQVALRLRIALRAQDTPARLGGDEFAAVLPGTDAAGATRTAERIVGALDGIGASIGIAVAPEHGEKPEELLAHADQAMYVAKARGGGYAIYATEEKPKPPRARRKHGFGLARRIAIGVAASLAILAGAMVQTSNVRTARAEDSAARLAAATSALHEATLYDVVPAFADVEVAVSEISWKDVGGEEVATALDELAETLDELKGKAPVGLATRVDALLDTVHRAQVVAKVVPEVSVPTPAPRKVPPPAK